METALKNKAIIYDNDCPMCCWYTDKFVKLGLLLPENRVPFSALDQEKMAQLDLNRCRHEIPLIDLNGSETKYGLNSMYTILGHYFPPFKKLFRQQWFNKLLKPVYNFISYNRRVMAGSPLPKKDQFDCSPDFHLGYRIAYYLFTIILCLLAVAGFQSLVGEHFVVAGGTVFLKLAAILAACWVSHTFLALAFLKGNIHEYWGNLASVKIVGLISLPMAVIIHQLTAAPGILLLGIHLGISLVLMLKEHHRRIKNTQEAPILLLIWLACLLILQPLGIWWFLC